VVPAFSLFDVASFLIRGMGSVALWQVNRLFQGAQGLWQSSTHWLPLGFVGVSHPARDECRNSSYSLIDLPLPLGPTEASRGYCSYFPRWA
jgi:hypothetical protein